MTWQASITPEQLQQRAALLQSIRQFFHQRGVLEVETPLLMPTTVTDEHLHSLQVGDKGYLQTSPEFAMKRLLAAGSGDIYQICKAFREDETGRLHNNEFTMLEWYRLGFDHHQLMDEMEALLRQILSIDTAQRYSYQDLFLKHLDMDPLQIPDTALIEKTATLTNVAAVEDRDTCLQLLLSHLIEPKLKGLTFIYDFPASQAALAKVRDTDGVAERFEVYIDGIELANGFHELTDVDEQRQRFQADLAKRQQKGLHCPPIDEKFLAALEAGLPACAGVALGIDRLVMIALGRRAIREVSCQFAPAASSPQ